jgi:hypothetical protein
MVMHEKKNQYDIAYCELYFIWDFVCAADIGRNRGQGEV